MSPVFRICYNFRILGERRNFCFAEIRRPDPLARLCTSAWLYGKFKPRHFERAVEGASPYRFVAVILWFCTIFIQFSSFKQGAGSAFLCDQNLSSCSPYSRWQNVSSYTATLQDIRFGIIPLYLSRKRGNLLHKKCNNCRNVAKLKYKSFVCTIC